MLHGAIRFGGEGEIGTAVALEYELPREWIDTAGSVQVQILPV